MSIKPIKPAGKSVNAPSWLSIVIEIIVIAILTGLLAVVLVEWMVGCGETWTDAQGVEHTGQCVFLPAKGEAK